MALTDPLISSSRQAHKDLLDRLDYNHQNHNGHQHHIRLIPVQAVADGNVSQTARADGSGHGGVSQDGCDGNRRSY